MKNNLQDSVNGMAHLFERGDVFSDKCPSRDILKHVIESLGCAGVVCSEGR